MCPMNTKCKSMKSTLESDWDLITSGVDQAYVVNRLIQFVKCGHIHNTKLGEVSHVKVI